MGTGYERDSGEDVFARFEKARIGNQSPGKMREIVEAGRENPYVFPSSGRTLEGVLRKNAQLVALMSNYLNTYRDFFEVVAEHSRLYIKNNVTRRCAGAYQILRQASEQLHDNAKIRQAVIAFKYIEKFAGDLNKTPSIEEQLGALAVEKFPQKDIISTAYLGKLHSDTVNLIKILEQAVGSAQAPGHNR